MNIIILNLLIMWQVQYWVVSSVGMLLRDGGGDARKESHKSFPLRRQDNGLNRVPINTCILSPFLIWVRLFDLWIDIIALKHLSNISYWFMVVFFLLRDLIFEIWSYEIKLLIYSKLMGSLLCSEILYINLIVM